MADRPFQVSYVLRRVVGCCSPSKLGLSRKSIGSRMGTPLNTAIDHVTTGVPGLEVLCGGFDSEGTVQPKG